MQIEIIQLGEIEPLFEITLTNTSGPHADTLRAKFGLDEVEAQELYEELGKALKKYKA